MENAPENVLRVMTFNVWGLPEVRMPVIGRPIFRPGGVQHKDLRVAELCKVFQDSYTDISAGWDVILLQEVWERKDRLLFKDCGYPHSVWFEKRSGNVLKKGSGLMILSRYPIVDADQWIFTRNGSREFRRIVSDGEALAEKSILLAKIRHPSGDLWVANLHLIARYYAFGSTEDLYVEQRRKQLEEASRWLEEKAGGERVILGGDFNTGPQIQNNFMYDEIFYEIGREFFNGFLSPNVPENLGDLLTVSVKNTYRTRKAPNDQGRIDHIFVSPDLQIDRVKLVFDQPIVTHKGAIHLSDHFGLGVHVSL